MNKTTGSEPLAEYRRRLNAIADSTNRYRRRDKVFAAAKLSLGILIVLAAIWLVKYHAAWLYLLLLPILLFVVLAILHERILKRMRCDARLQSYYYQGIARIENRWAGIGETGERFLDPSHPYARDLDIFGAGSLFQLLCTARTSSGEQTLAAWLMTAAPVPEIAARQEAVQELAPKIDLRERLVLAGEEVKKTVHPEALIAWSENEQPLNRASIRLATLILTALWLLSLLAWWRWDWMAVALAMSLINFGVSYKLRSRTNRAAEGVDGAQHDLALLAGILKIIEAEAAAAPKIVQLQSRLSRSGVPASQAIAALSKRVEWLESNDNWFVKIFDPFIFYFPHCVMAIDAWRARHGAAIRDWLSVTGEVEALTSFALYAYEHPTDTFPQMLEGEPYLDGEGLAHPLLARESAVANNLKLDRNLQLLVISGPNMAGKSTFIRSIGINAVLAQAGAPVCARRMTLSSLQIAASICILDSLQGGLSRFYAEISRLKQIDELSKRDTPVLFLLDELLSGTNSYDRRIGTESFVRSLLSRGAIGLVTTHDLALAEIAERIGTTAANFHFEDTFEDGKLHFDYKLTPGIVQTTNALLLMRSIGLDV